MPVLEAKEIRKGIQNGRASCQRLAGVDFQVDKGEFIAIMGPSAGQVHTSASVGRLGQPDGGEMSFLADQPLAKLSERKATLVRGHNVGFVFSSSNLCPLLSRRRTSYCPSSSTEKIRGNIRTD